MFASQSELPASSTLSGPSEISAAVSGEDLARALESCRRFVEARGVEAWLAQAPEVGGRERSYLRLPAGLHCEAWLIRWPPGSYAPLHDHGTAYGVAQVVSGSLREWRYEGGEALPARDWSPARAVVLARDVCHEVHNLGDETAYSIHVYAPRLEHMTFYSRDEDGALLPLRQEASTQW